MTTKNVKVLIVPANESRPVRYATIKGDLDGFQTAIGGGWLEPITGVTPLTETPWTAYCDEEGKLKGLARNSRAQRLAKALHWQGRPGDYLCGPVVFCGPADNNGDDTDVPDMIVSKAILWEWIEDDTPRQYPDL